MTDDKTTTAELSGRLTMAKALAQLWSHAYDALLHHGVNFKSLPEWKDPEPLDAIGKLPFHRGAQEYVSWMGRVQNAITAAVRRKGFKVVGNKKEDTE